MGTVESWTNFERHNGGVAGARERFEVFCAELLDLENPSLEVHQIAANPGDDGIDVLVTHPEGIDIYQCKYFRDILRDAQWKQIRDSFNTAIHKNTNILSWYLCLPRQLTILEMQRWREFKRKHNIYDFAIKIIDGNQLISRAQNLGISEKWFSPIHSSPPMAAEENVLDIDLKTQGHWLLNCNRKSEGLMDDQKVVNLASLLLGMTDAYAVILATTWRNGIAYALEKILNQFADRNHLERENLPFPKWREVQNLNYLAQVGEGIVVNIMASQQDIVPRIGDMLRKYEAVPLIVNIWSEKPAEALEATASIHENPQLQGKADFVSLIDYNTKLDIRTQRTTDIAKNHLEQLKCKGVKEKTMCLLKYKDQNTRLWWDLIPEFAAEKDVEENFIGYMIAQSSEAAVQRWLNALAYEEIEKLFKDDILYSLFKQDKIDDLVVHLWRYIRKFPNYGYCAWEDCFQRVRKCCSEHTTQLLEVLEGECEMNDSVDMFTPENIRIWADLVKSTDFERDIGKVQRNQAFYWIAIMRNINGAEYVIKERMKQQNQRFVSKLLNRAPKKESDEFIEDRTNYIRKYIRTK